MKILVSVPFAAAIHNALPLNLSGGVAGVDGMPQTGA
jgi:hypothetical protein